MTTLWEDPKFVKETLAWCNTIRAEKGHEPLERLPKGERDNGESCPCGRATGVFVDIATWGPDIKHRKMYHLPPEVQQFVIEFDSGGLPEYDENPWIPEDEEGERSAP